MKKILALFALSMIILSTSVMASDTYPVIVRPLINGTIQPNTAFYYEFLFTNDNVCSVIYKNSTTTITTDQYGIGSDELDISGISGTPNYVCEYRSGSLRKVHNVSASYYDDIRANNIYSDYFIGDGSLLTNIVADGLDINDDEMLYFNTLNTVGIRYNSSGGAPNYLEVVNSSLLVPNMISSNSVDAELGYFNYLQMGYKGYSTGNPFTVLNSTGTQKLKIDFSGDITFLDDEESNYITWITDESNAGIGLWNYPTYKSLELWSGSEPDDTIELYNPTNVWGNLTAVSGSMIADYFVGDGSQLTNLPISSYNLTYDLTSQDVLANRTSWFSTYNSSYITNTYNLTYDSTSLDVTANRTAWFLTYNSTYDSQTNYWNRSAPTIFPAFYGDSITIQAGSLYFDKNYTIDWEGKTLTYNSTNSQFEFNDRLYAPNINTQTTSSNGIGTLAQTNLKGSTLVVGNTTGNQSFTQDGTRTSYGTAKKYKSISMDNRYLYGIAGTYNGIVCTASGLASLSARWLGYAVGDGAGTNVCDAMITNIIMPTDYEEGTDIIITIDWTTAPITGNAFFGIGIMPVGTGENMIGTTTYQTGTSSAQGTTYYKSVFSTTHSGTGIQKGDNIAIVIYRHGDSLSDTLVGDAFVVSANLKYLSNVDGE